MVEQVQHELLEAPIQVYNLEVADFHTYFVSDSAVLVHNKCQDIPKEAYDVVDYAENNNGRAQENYHGNLPYKNDGRGGTEILPNPDGTLTFREYDIYSLSDRAGRGVERVVIASNGSRMVHPKSLL